MNLKDQLRRDEGVRDTPYLCSAGAWTIGVGWNVTANGLPAHAAHDLLSHGKIFDEDIARLLNRGIEIARKDAKDFMGWKPGLPGLNLARMDALTNMAFNLGRNRLFQFKRMREALQNADWDRAADEALDSRWAMQVGERAVRIVSTLRTGEAA